MKTKMILRPKLDENFETFSKEVFESAFKESDLTNEEYNQNYRKFNLKTIRIAVPVLIAVLAFGFLSVHLLWLLLVVVFVSSLITSNTEEMMMNRSWRANKKILNQSVYPFLLKYFYPETDFISTKLHAKEAVKACKLPIRTSKFGRQINLKIGEIHFELYINSETSSYDDDSSLQESQGVLCSIDFNKNFSGQTIVLNRDELLMVKKKYSKNRDAELVSLESSLFEKYFAVYSTDQVQARYILSPNFMQVLLNYERRMKKKISLSFINNKLFVLFPLETQLFDCNSHSHSDCYQSIMTDIKKFLRITDVVYHLNLNNDMWS